MSRYILLTGGTGFIGSNLLEELLNLNKKVILLKRSFSNTWRINEFIGNENLVLKDIDKENLKDIFGQYDIEGIFHLSSLIQRNHELDAINNIIDSNINFPTQLLENSVENDVEFFINTGTCLEYKSMNRPLKESDEIKPFNLYAASKVAFEDILKFYYDNYDLNCSTLKLFTPYGPKDNETKIMPYLITNSIKKNDIIIKSPEKRLDFIFIDDVVDSYISVMNNFSKLDEYESFNIGTGIGTSIKDVLEIIESYLGTNKNVTCGNLENDQICCCNDKIREKLNWMPKTDLKNGIEQTIGHYTHIYGEL